MRNLRRTRQHSRQLISPLLICSLFFLIMCPFAHSLTPCSQAPVLIPQKHVVENWEQPKGHSDSPLYHTATNLFDYQPFDKTLTCSFTEQAHEGLYSRALITSSRLII